MSLDEEYANAAYIPRGEEFPARWSRASQAFRDGHKLKELGVSYGVGPRNYVDIYHPNRAAKGTVVFVHGGYWLAFGPSDFSHLASGALAAGYAVAMPAYTLAPQARISEITAEVAEAIRMIAARTQGPLYLAGHSAGGHLVARMVCADQTADWSGRVARVMPISPLSDLEPLMATSMNATLGLDADEVIAESPVQHDRQDIPVTVCVGQAERPAFLVQAQLLASKWDCDLQIEPARHHFDVIDGLLDPNSQMLRALLS